MTAHLKPYPEYKDSNVSWLGEMPNHWGLDPGLSAFSTKKEKNIGLKEKTVLSLSYGRIVVKPPEKLHGLVPESFETYQIVDPGDIIIRSTDLQNDWNSLRVGLVENRGIITSAYMCLKTKAGMIPAYCHLLLHSYDLMKIFYGMGSGLRQNLDWSDFKRLLLLIPPLEEQKAIVSFIKSINKKISRFIKVKKRMIEVLKEQKQAIINKAVTKGLDPNVKLKPSCVDHLGDIPEHWEVQRIKYLFSEIDLRKSKDDYILLSFSRSKGLIPHSQISKRPPSAKDLSKYKVCKIGNLLMNRMQAWSGMFTAVEIEGIVSPDYSVYKYCGAGKVKYYGLLFKIISHVRQFCMLSKGVGDGFNRLYTPDFGSVYTLVPPNNEQELILKWIANRTLHLNEIISRNEREIELMHEYRTRLISDVVTGKIDVRDIDVEPVDDIEETEELEDIEENEELTELQEVADDDD